MLLSCRKEAGVSWASAQKDARVRVSVRRVAPVEKPAPVETSGDRRQADAGRTTGKTGCGRCRSDVEQPAAPKPVAAVKQTVSPQPAADQAEIPGVSPEVIAVTKEVVEELLRLMGLKGQVTMRGAEPRGARTPDDGTSTCTQDVSGDDLGILIGRRGENLSALQYMTNLIVAKRTTATCALSSTSSISWCGATNPCAGLAQRMAERVKQSNSPITLEPMPPHERRIIHRPSLSRPTYRLSALAKAKSAVLSSLREIGRQTVRDFLAVGTITKDLLGNGKTTIGGTVTYPAVTHKAWSAQRHNCAR